MILFFLVFCPIAAAALILLGAPARMSALGAAIANVFATLIVLVRFDRTASGFQFINSLTVSSDWQINLAFGIDGLSLLMLLLATIVTLAAIWFTGKIDNHERAFYACLLLISAGAIGAFASLDLFFFYAFHELALIPTFLLIGIWGTGDRIRAAWKITIYLTLGSFILLIGLILLYESVPPLERSFSIPALQEAVAVHAIGAADQRHIYLLLLVGFGVLVSLFPFHSWAPDAYASAPAPAAMLHAGVLKKFGLYGLLRLAIPMLPEGAHQWMYLLAILLLGNIIYIGLVTLTQKRLDWMLGYSSVMHMGYIFLGIASANILGTTGAAALIFAHGLSIALLFAIAGEIRKRTATLAFEDLGGLAKVMPFAGLAFGFGAFASIGLPGFANFASEIMVFFGAIRNGWSMERFHIFQIATVLALWGVVISTIYMLRAYRATFMGPLNERWNKLVDLGAAVKIPIALLIAGLLWFGFFPQTLVQMVMPTFRTYFTAGK
ncbi:MAG TPA: NADH-quinone oxidoreductase subunit M [Chthoniobacterales bacterium]|nr:NADH-quinone oxidoreductase subunit M [Chthoniobacterales bacterium]